MGTAILIKWTNNDIINFVKEEYNTILTDQQASEILERFDYYNAHPGTTQKDFDLIESCYKAWLDENIQEQFLNFGG